MPPDPLSAVGGSLGVEYLFDENLIRVGRVLRQLRPDFAVVGQPPIADLLPSGIVDSAWIPVVASNDWIVITDDRHLRTRPDEAAYAVASGLRVVHLHRAGDRSRWSQAVQLLSHWHGIERFIERRPRGPWWLSVRSNGVREMSFAPGLAGRDG